MGLEKFFDKLEEWRVYRAHLSLDEREAIQRKLWSHALPHWKRSSQKLKADAAAGPKRGNRTKGGTFNSSNSKSSAASSPGAVSSPGLSSSPEVDGSSAPPKVPVDPSTSDGGAQDIESCGVVFIIQRGEIVNLLEEYRRVGRRRFLRSAFRLPDPEKVLREGKLAKLIHDLEHGGLKEEGDEGAEENYATSTGKEEGTRRTTSKEESTAGAAGAAGAASSSGGAAAGATTTATGAGLEAGEKPLDGATTSVEDSAAQMKEGQHSRPAALCAPSSQEVLIDDLEYLSGLRERGAGGAYSTNAASTGSQHGADFFSPLERLDQSVLQLGPFGSSSFSSGSSSCPGSSRSWNSAGVQKHPPPQIFPLSFTVTWDPKTNQWIAQELVEQHGDADLRTLSRPILCDVRASAPVSDTDLSITFLEEGMHSAGPGAWMNNFTNAQGQQQQASGRVTPPLPGEEQQIVGVSTAKRPSGTSTTGSFGGKSSTKILKYLDAEVLTADDLNAAIETQPPSGLSQDGVPTLASEDSIPGLPRTDSVFVQFAGGNKTSKLQIGATGPNLLPHNPNATICPTNNNASASNSKNSTAHLAMKSSAANSRANMSPTAAAIPVGCSSTSCPGCGAALLHQASRLDGVVHSTVLLPEEFRKRNEPPRHPGAFLEQKRQSLKDEEEARNKADLALQAQQQRDEETKLWTPLSEDGIEKCLQLALRKIHISNEHAADDTEKDLLFIEEFLHSSITLLPSFGERHVQKIRLLVVAGYILAAPAFYCTWDTEGVCSPPDDNSSPYIKALYFTAVSLSTVGFGDVTPASDIAKIFTIFYLLFGLAIILGAMLELVADALDMYFDYLEEKEKRKKLETQKKKKRKKMIEAIRSKAQAAIERDMENYVDAGGAEADRIKARKEKLRASTQARLDNVLSEEALGAVDEQLEQELRLAVEADAYSDVSDEQKLTPEQRAERAKDRLTRCANNILLDHIWNCLNVTLLRGCIQGSFRALWYIAPPPLKWLLKYLWETVVDIVLGRTPLERSCAILVYRKLFETLCLIFFPALLGASVIGTLEDWDWIDSAYWSVVAVTTVGYGDLVITEMSSRIFCIGYLLIAATTVSAALGNLASVHVLKRRMVKEWRFKQRKLTPDMMAEMDTDGDGVDQFEFCLATLVATEKVERVDLEPIMEKFRELDADKSGVLTKADMLVRAEKMDDKDEE
ncbi:unnamed protein product [Amoebophrya sp. A25]|nr:unnamed protein product [Amoebophrya sp. A25]|eukprot:GSA25T00023789001.1